MRLILTQDVDKLGHRGDVVKVAPGYGRNYLLPHGMALLATDGNLKQVELEKKRWAKQEAKEKEAAEVQAQELVKATVTVARKVGDNDHLFGSVTSADIAEGLAEHGFTVDKRKIGLDEPVKELGEFEIPIRLHREVVAQIKLNVVREE